MKDFQLKIFFCPSATALTLLFPFLIHLAASARSSVDTSGSYLTVGPRDVPPACSAEYGTPVREDCLQALNYMIEDIVPPGYDWHGLNALGNVHNSFGIQAREFRAAGDRRARRFPEYDMVELPRVWSS
ncbi:MAG: hypothetical protein M1835_006840, partial [Candelina submexicana]